MNNQTIFDNFLKSYEDKTYKYPTLVRHKGTVIAFAMDNERRIYYTVLDLSDSDENKGPIDVEYWSKNPSKLHFANEIGQVGYGLVGATRMPTVKKGTLTEDKPENLNLDEIDEFLSTTARLTADAPFQVLSDDQYIYVFRQSIADNDPNIVYKLTRLEGGGSSGDTTNRQDSEFVLSGGNKVPLVNNTLLLDRFILGGTQLQPKMEVRYKRSRNKTQPANSKDSLGAKDIEGKAFYEPTQELDFVQQLQGGRFQVLLLPTQIANIQRWQVFTYNSATSKIDSFNIERSGDGLFNTKGTIYYTSPDAEYQNAIFQRRPGVDSFTNQELVPILNAKSGAESALSFDGTDNYVDLGNPSQLQITGSQTIEMWVKPLSLANRQSLFCKAYNGEGAITLEVDGKLSYYYGTGGDNPNQTSMDIDTFQGILSNFGLLRDEWSHIAIVRNFESRTLTWYIDGAFAGEEIITKDAATASNENVFLAKGYADNFNGCIDEVRIWNRARTGYEINEDRHHRLVGRETGLVGYWRFDENTGATVYDQTDSANNGTIHGATWEESDALIGNHPGVSRDSFSFTGRTIESGLTAVQYFQQEDAQIGNEQESKPMKTNARVMLAVATGGTDADGATTTNKYIAALDFAVSREGRLAQVPDNISLNWLNRTDIDGDSIETSFAAVGSLEAEISQLKRDIQRLNVEIEELQGIPDKLEEIEQQKQELEARLQEVNDMLQVLENGGTIGRPDHFGSIFIDQSSIPFLRTSQENLSAQITQLENQKLALQNQESLYDSKIAERNEKQTTLNTKEQELEGKKEQLYGQVSLPMALLHTDSDGLTTSGALLGFAHTADTPQLFDSAMGKLALYFQGTNTQFFTAYYDTKTARAQKVIDMGGKKVRFIARSVGAESNAATITISDGNNPDTCEVTIANSQTEITETWKDVPRDPRMFSKVLNGQAKPLYLGQVAETSGTVTELTLVETTNRQLAAGAVLKIGDTKVTTSAEVAVNSSSIPVNSVSLEVQEETPVYLVLYDYAAHENDLLSSTALDFNGSTDYIEIGHFNPGNTFTIELWIKYKTNGIHCFIGKNTNTGGNFFLFGYWNSEYRIIMPNNRWFVIPIQITVGEWLHVAAVIKENQGNSEIKFYQDGLLISEDTLETTLGNIEGKPWSLGQEWDDSTKSDFVNGQMDEVRIWNYDRSEEQIQANKDRRLSGNESGLVGYWHFAGGVAKDYSGNGNDGTIHGTPQNVSSPPLARNSYVLVEKSSEQFLVYSEATAGTIPNGTVTSLGDAPSCRWVADPPGLALDFDGQNKYLALADNKIPQMDAIANLTIEAWVKPKLIGNLNNQESSSALEFNGSTDYIDCGTKIQITESITVEAWVKHQSGNTEGLIVYTGGGWSDYGYSIFWYNNKIRIELQRSGQKTACDNNAPSHNEWHHIAFTWDNTSNTIITYIDGNPQPVTATFTGSIGIPTQALNIGRGQNIGNYFQGAIDDVRIWNYARSEEQIQANKDRQLTGNEAGLAGYWHFEGGTAKDYSGNGNDGTIHGNPQNISSSPLARNSNAGRNIDTGRVIHHKSANSQYTLGLQKQELMSALEFNGSTDYVEIGHFHPGNTFTIELWVKLKANNSGCFIGKNTNVGENLFWIAYSGRLSLVVGQEYCEISDQRTLGEWFHLAVVIKENQGNSEINVYQDGLLISERTLASTLGNIEGKPWTLGQEWDYSTRSDFFNGQMDEVRIWNYARSEEQIQAHKDRRLSGNESGLVGYWHFEGGVAKDYSGNGNDGTVYGNPNNVVSPLSEYKIFGGVGVGDRLGQTNRFLKTKELLPINKIINKWNHLALSYHQSYALNFDGNDYLDCGKNRALNLCEDLTIETVIEVIDTNLRSIISKSLIGSGIEKESVPYALQVEAGKLIFSFEDSQGTIHKLESPANKIQTNTVHKIAVTRQKVTQTTDSGADPDAWGTGDVANIDAKTGNFTSSENQKIDKAMKADYVASKKRGKNLKDGLQSQSSSTPSQQPTFINGQGTAQWLELKMYIDEILVCSLVIEPAVSPEGNSQPLEIGRTGESYFLGKISEVKLWSRALEKGEIHQNITGQEEGLVAWWQLEENEGNLANDFKGGNHAQIKGATWCKNPDVEASELLLYSNGVPLTTESVDATDSLTTDWGDNQFTLGGRKDGGSYQECFNGILEEVRVWKVVRTQEQILDNIFTRLKGEKPDLLANYTFDEIINNEFQDSSLMGNHLPLGADANKPTSVFSDAPLGNDIPQVRSALAAIQTVFNAQIDSSPAVTEYGDMQYDSQQNLTGVFKRCYTYIKDGKWRLITGYKVGNLITEWVSQVQFDPQIIGYIEGAPPIPSENMTVGPISLGDTDTYKQASTVELIEAEDINYNFSSSKENGFDSSFEAAMSTGVELDLRTLLAPLGFGISFKAKVAFKVSGSGKFQSSGGWTDESRITSGRTVTRNMRATAVGYWEDKNNLLNPRLGQRYVPNNQGFALVQSETADVFALRLAHNKALISYRFQPNPDIPKDWNIISFPINPRYTKQGTLDGKVGYQPDGSVQTDPDYPQATQYGEYSYFKPIETYALKRQIEREAAELKNYYDNYDASPLSNSILKDVMSTNAGLLASAAGAIPIGGIGLGAATTFGSLADALTKDQSLPEKFATRNIANTYVWTADGGFYAETTNTMDVRQESSSGSYSFNTNFTGGISLNVSAAGSFGFDLNGSTGGHLNMTQSKSAETSQSFRLEVQVNPQNNLYKYEVPEDQKDWESTYVDYLLQYDTEGNPIKVPGKVDAYRFMTFYLEPKAENFEDFYAKVVDPIWIEQSDNPNAQALREARQTEKKPACWRIMHRVTFVSRLLQDFNDDAVSQLAKDARALNIESNWQLIKTLEPFVKNKTDNFVQFADAVRDALEQHLPELQPHSPEIIAYMAQYYGLPEDA